MESLQALGVARALVLFNSIPIWPALTKPAQIHCGLYCKTVSIPTQHDFSGIVSFDPMLRYERQSIMLNITDEQSSVDGPGAGAPTGDFVGCDLLRAWIGVTSDDDDSNSNKMERRRDCFIIGMFFFFEELKSLLCCFC